MPASLPPSSPSSAPPSTLRRTFGLAGPLLVGALATNLMGVIDTAMVGQLGTSALAGVGLASQLFFLVLALLLGIAAAVQARVAQAVGAGQWQLTGRLLNSGLVLAAGAGFLVIAFSYLLLPGLLAAIQRDALVVVLGGDYLDTRLPSLLFLALNLSFRAYWVGVSQAVWSMITILVLSVANVLFNYALIFGNFGAPALGVAGAGLGSTLAVALATLLNIVLAIWLARGCGFLQGLMPRHVLLDMLRVASPESLRQLLFTAGVALSYVIIGFMSTAELAAFYVMVNVSLLVYLPHMGFAGAATTLTGEALGAGQHGDIGHRGWTVSATGLVVMLGLAGLVWLNPHTVLELFSLQEAAVVWAVLPLQLIVLAHVLDGCSKIFAGAMIGIGATSKALYLTLWPQWLLLLPGLALAVYFGQGLEVAAWLFVGWGAITCLCFACAWLLGVRDEFASASVAR